MTLCLLMICHRCFRGPCCPVFKVIQGNVLDCNGESKLLRNLSTISVGKFRETPGSTINVEKASFSENSVSPKTVVFINNAVKLPNLARTKYTEHLEQLKYRISFISWKQLTKAGFLSYEFKQLRSNATAKILQYYLQLA